MSFLCCKVMFSMSFISCCSLVGNTYRCCEAGSLLVLMSQHHSCISVTAYDHAAIFLNRKWNSALVPSCHHCIPLHQQRARCFFNTSWESHAFNRGAPGTRKVKAARCWTGTRSPLCCLLCLCQSPKSPSWSCCFPCGVGVVATAVGTEGTWLFGSRSCCYDFLQGPYFRLGTQLYHNVS